MSTKNQYEKSKTKKNLLGAITAEQETEGNIAGSGIETAKDLVIGVIGGGVAGAIAGKFSLLAGAVITGIGHYKKSRLATSFGIGMMASGTYRNAQTMSGISQGGLAGAKERVIGFKDAITEKFFLDKILKKKTEATNGVGEVRYFLPSGENGTGELDLSALDRIEKQVAQSASQYSQVSGMGELGELGEPLDLGSQNY